MSDGRRQTAGVMNANEDCLLGEVVELRAVAGEPLPPGTGEGFQVRVIALGTDGGIVEREGREWQVSRSQIRRRCRGIVSFALGTQRRCGR